MLKTPFAMLDEYTIGINYLNLEDNFSYSLRNNYTSVVTVIMPTDTKYNGVHSSLFNGSYSDRTSTLMRIVAPSYSKIDNLYPRIFEELVSST